MSDVTIEVSGLCKRFGPVLALDGMTFTVTPGQPLCPKGSSRNRDHSAAGRPA